MARGKKSTPPLLNAVTLPPADLRVTVSGYVPTPEQQRLKSAFWARWADDPMVDPENLTGEEVARRLREPDVERWFANESCKRWFLNKDTAREGIEYLLDTWIDKAANLLVSDRLGDREFLALGKLLTDLSPRTKAPPVEEDAKVTPERMKALVERAAKQLGWSPPVSLPSPEPKKDS